MKKIKRFFQRLFCKHTEADLLRWHWAHGPYGDDHLFIQAEYRCKECGGCGKIVYLYQHGKEAQDWAKAMGDYKKA